MSGNSAVSTTSLPASSSGAPLRPWPAAHGPLQAGGVSLCSAFTRSGLEGSKALRRKRRSKKQPRVTLPYDVLLQVFVHIGGRTHYRDGSRDWTAARSLAQLLFGLCLVARDFKDYFQPLLWAEVPLGNVSDKDERQTILSFIATARARQELAARITAIRLVKPHRPPAGPPSAESIDADKALESLCRALSRFPALTSINLPGAMVGAYLAMETSDVPLLSAVTLSGPPSDAFLGLRNLQTVHSLRLDHPWLATPAFLDRVHIQLDGLTALHLQHFSLATSHPALSFLLGGPFGKRLTELSIQLSPESPSPGFSTHLLSLVPNLTYLSLSADGVDISNLPLLAHLSWLHLHHSHLDMRQTDDLLDAIAASRSADVTHRPLTALRAIQLDGKPGARKTLRLAEVGLALLGPDDDVLFDQQRVIGAKLDACRRGRVKETVRELKRRRGGGRTGQQAFVSPGILQ